ncbi:hypothetical protein CSOJ01_08041 [Colletotrichum sojae]|uniref:Uncharacterized protein n=1 Tax=Colletotrichum sojae TaxID=2175907 RepID=A0A8H6MSN0_9PEZI|nr:hypothetical protein CSOJ01_08041 [Colletotrichum sojae]
MGSDAAVIPQEEISDLAGFDGHAGKPSPDQDAAPALRLEHCEVLASPGLRDSWPWKSPNWRPGEGLGEAGYLTALHGSGGVIGVEEFHWAGEGPTQGTTRRDKDTCPSARRLSRYATMEGLRAAAVKVKRERDH